MTKSINKLRIIVDEKIIDKINILKLTANSNMNPYDLKYLLEDAIEEKNIPAKIDIANWILISPIRKTEPMKSTKTISSNHKKSDVKPSKKIEINNEKKIKKKDIKNSKICFTSIAIILIIFLIISSLYVLYHDYRNNEEESYTWDYLSYEEEQIFVEKVIPIVKKHENIKAISLGKNNFSSFELPTIKGGVICWGVNLTTGDKYFHRSYVPSDLIPKTSHTNFTIIVIINSSYEFVGYWYDTSGKEYPGYRTITDLIIIYWPEKIVAGKFRVLGEKLNYKESVYTWTYKFSGDNNIDCFIESLSRE